MWQIIDPSDPKDHNAAQIESWAQFKREVMQVVLGYIFSSIEHQSSLGQTLRCNDDIIRVLHTCFLIESVDREEAADFTGCWHATANFPCPKCFAHKFRLNQLLSHFKLRTPQNMQDQLAKARNAGSKAQRDNILQENGMHDVEVSFLAFFVGWI